MFQCWLRVLLIIGSNWTVSGAIQHHTEHELFPTKKIRHVEPLRALNIHHEDIGNPQQLRIKYGLHQPYPDQIEVQFEAYGKKISYPNLLVDEKLVAPHSTTEVHYDDGIVIHRPNKLITYSQGSFLSKNGAVVVMLHDGNFTATFFHEGEIHYAEPLHYHTSDIEDRVFSTLSQHAVHNMVVFKASDIIIDLKNPPTCGSIDQNSRVTRHPLLHSRLLNVIPEWDCAGDGLIRKLKVGWAADYGFVKSFPSTDDAEAAILSYIKLSNEVYVNQVMVYLEASGIVLMNTAATGQYETWNTDSSSCYQISDKFLQFSEWRAKVKPNTFGLWHLLTDCYPSGTVGLGTIGCLCQQELFSSSQGRVTHGGIAVSSRTRSTWKTVAHEIGHNFGLQHSFDDSSGTRVHYGGIMDYGDGYYEGDIQFNTPLRKPEGCAEIQEALADKKANNRYSNVKYVDLVECLVSFNPVCGNGVIEPPDEVCDFGSDQLCCASDCTFKASTQCSGESECCSNCKYLPITTTCASGTGFCNNGVCDTKTVCEGYGWGFGGVGICSDECHQACIISGSCNNLQYWTLSGVNGKVAAQIADGAMCSSNGGTCLAGECKEPAQATAGWFESGFSQCDVQCGSGNKYQTVECRKPGSTAAVDDSQCSGTEPQSQEGCTVSPYCAEYSWTKSNYGQCSSDCKYAGQSSPTKTRIVTCADQMGIVVDDVYCASLGSKPKTENNCNNNACPVAWVQVGDWSECSKECGTGVRTLVFQCQEDRTTANVQVSETYCSSLASPTTSENCNEDVCAEYEYTYGLWSDCDKDCGGGTRTRTVYCSDVSVTPQQTQSTYSECETKTLPASTEDCNSQSCPLYEWLSASWEPRTCPTVCGSSSDNKQIRTVTCINENSNNQLVSDTYCTKGKPNSQQACPETAACKMYEWRFDSWGDCMKGGGIASCDEVGGSKMRTVNCNEVSTQPPVQVADGDCDSAGSKPATSEGCTGVCVPSDSFKWVASLWDLVTCSKPCGQGTMSRSVICQDPDGNAVQGCKSQQPAVSAACNAFACPSWVLGEWNECSTLCDQGTQSRTVLCKNHLGALAASQLECALSKPPATQPCNIQPCPHWHREPWGSCSKVCTTVVNDVSYPGYKYRTLTCRMPHDGYYKGRNTDESLCPTLTPDDVDYKKQEVCNEQYCTPYYWDVDQSEWSECSQECGNDPGTQTANFVCYDLENGNTVVDDENCESAGMKPGSRACNDYPCPIPKWHQDAWTDCSADCGGGVRTRTVTCLNELEYFDKNIYDIIDDSFCVNIKPQSSESCNTESNCGSGQCVQGKCTCSPGHSSSLGNLCDIEGTITNVEVTGPLSLVPPGEPLTLRWQTTGAIDLVSIMLIPKGSSDFPTYIETSVPNSLFYIYITPSHLPAGTYTIMVFFSDSIKGESSKEFVVEAPCNHVFCGPGTCSNGMCTCPSPYDGEFCENDNFYGVGSCDQGICTCGTGFRGDFCLTPATCTPLACKNGAVPKGVADGCPVKCGNPNSDVCPYGFDGTLCDQCSTQCENGGIHESEGLSKCVTCKCAPGYFSNFCNCEYGMVNLALTKGSPSFQTPNGLDILRNDVARALRLDVRWIMIEESSSSSNNEFTAILYNQQCPSYHHSPAKQWDNVYDGLMGRSESMNPTMQSIEDIKSQLFNPTSVLRNGYLTKSLDPSIFSYVKPPSVIDKCATRTCSSHGLCNVATGACICDTPFIGDNCGVVDLCFGETCNGNGVCSRGVCDCTSGWLGSRCSLPSNPCDDNNCNGHGTCVNSMCRCNGGYVGVQCEVRPDACYEKDCGGNTQGTCIAGMCYCLEGFTGVDCGITVDLCPVGKCNYHGDCDAGVCTCYDGYLGQTCSQSSPTCSDGQKNNGEEKTDCGGPCPNACPSCNNGIQDRGETEVDCGGSCLPCATCGDAIKNGDETDIDCGGSICASCGAAPTCSDGSKNGEEKGIDCGGESNCPACITYAWFAQNVWSSCTADCGEGIQTRVRVCKDQATNSTVNDELCSHLHPVSSSQSCNQQACPVYTWETGLWGDCSAPCGTGIKIRDLTCQKDGRLDVPRAFCDSYALETKPSENSPCNAEDCSPASYGWYLDPLWGDCTENCGGGKQTRGVYCGDYQKVTAADEYCTKGGIAKPISERDCNPQSCDDSSWLLCPWSECTAVCGGGESGGTAGGSMLGERTRTVMCQENGVLVDDSYCDEAERKLLVTSEVGCNAVKCTDYNWMTTMWTSCKVTEPATGKGVRLRTYHCHAPDGSNAKIEECELYVGYLKPEIKQECWDDRCPAAVKDPEVITPDTDEAIPVMGRSILTLWVVALNWFVVAF